MKKWNVAVFATALILAGCSSMRVYIDYDESVDFDSYRTFKFRDAPDGSLSKSAPLIHERLVASIEAQMEAGGLEKVDSNADIFVTYYTSTRQEFQANTTHFGYGYPSRWGRYGYYGGPIGGSSTTRVTSYDVGTLVIDVWDSKEKALVWRGVAEDTVPSNPDKLTQKVDKAIGKMVQRSQEQM